jgi:hypothetical protein
MNNSNIILKVVIGYNQVNDTDSSAVKLRGLY